MKEKGEPKRLGIIKVKKKDEKEVGILKEQKVKEYFVRKEERKKEVNYES